MHRNVLLSLALIAVVTLGMVGCKSNPTSPYETDEEAIQALVGNSEWFNADDHFEGGVDSSGVLLGNIIPFAWGRQRLDPIQRIITINQVGDSAYVTVQGKITGVLHIWAFQAGVDTLLKIKKDLEIDFTRNAIFKKTGSEEGTYRGWVLEKISGADAVSTPTYTVEIDSVRIQGETLDVMITDPGALFSLADAITFVSGETVTFTLFADDSSALAYLHPWRLVRMPFVNNGDGSYSGAWAITSAGFHRVAFDLIRRETLFDDTYDHDSNIWVFPYRVEPGE